MAISPPPMVPQAYAEELAAQLSAALQIIAALLPLSDEEVILAQASQDPLGDNGKYEGWAQGMKDDLLANRDTLVGILSKQGFRTNTHSGFCLGPLTPVLPDPFLMAKASAALQQVLNMCDAGQMVLTHPLDIEPAKRKILAILKESPFMDGQEKWMEAAVEWLFSDYGIGLQQLNRALMKQLVREGRE